MIWLAAITLPDGRTYRAASEPTSVSARWTTTGGPFSYAGLLIGAPEYAEEVDLFSLDASGGFSQARIQIRTTDDLAALHSDYHQVAAATGELAVLFEGDKYEDRRVLLSGAPVQALELGQAGEPTSFTLESIAGASSASVGDDNRDLGVEWPDPLTDTTGAAMTSLAGRKQVHVLGDPHGIPGYKVGNVGGTNRLVLCGHHLPVLTAVNIYEDGVAAGVFTPVNGISSHGDYAYVTSAAAHFTATNGAYTWDAVGGLSSATDFTQPALRASGVLRRLLDLSGILIDWRRMEESLLRLDRYQMGLWIDKETPALDIIRDRLIPLLPIVEIMGTGGIWYAVSDPHQRRPVVTLTEGQQLVDRVGGMTFSDRDAVRNRFVINFGYDAMTRQTELSVEITKDDDTLCYLSDQLYGEQADDPIEATEVDDIATAYALLRARSARLALRRPQVSFVADPDELGKRRAGDVVLLTSSSYGMTSVRAVLRRIEYHRDWLRYDLDIVERTSLSREA